MNLTLKSTLAAALIACAGLSSAVPIDTGNELIAALEKPGTQADFALGYIVGVVTYGITDGVICMPNGVTQGQVRDMVRNKLIDNPQARHLAAHIFVLATMEGAFPCKPAVAPTKAAPGRES